MSLALPGELIRLFAGVVENGTCPDAFRFGDRGEEPTACEASRRVGHRRLRS